MPKMLRELAWRQNGQGMPFNNISVLIVKMKTITIIVICISCWSTHTEGLNMNLKLFNVEQAWLKYRWAT